MNNMFTIEIYYLADKNHELFVMRNSVLISHNSLIRAIKMWFLNCILLILHRFLAEYLIIFFKLHAIRHIPYGKSYRRTKTKKKPGKLRR